MRLIHISVGGPDINLFAGGRIWRFEDHPYCGPMLINKDGSSAKEPPPNSIFWKEVSKWYQSGKKTKVEHGKTWAVICA